ncbi:sialin isoform X2 [Agrilus planipennis]|uniref:Sialin n=1 Tax=Agrilus planipennis TaxID=224129 RepID=A0A1W4XUW2_AGRPL|nr:sialin isoform X2 [Agrilus planipennis]
MPSETRERTQHSHPDNSFAISEKRLDEEDENEEKIPWWKIWKRRRYLVACLAFLGFCNIYTLRVNLSIAVVAMTENKSVILENGTTIYKPEFDWNSKQTGLLLSSFFFGYITTQFVGGFIGAKVGGKKVFGLGLLVTAILTLLTPLLAKLSYEVLLAVRIVEGVFEGVTYPCIHAVWARWAPPLERSRLATIAFAGSYVGTVIAMTTGALLANAFGWESIFYVFGVIAVIWFLAWWFIVAESPSEDPHISKKELKYILKALGDRNQNNVKHPWKDILSSAPVWAIIVSHFSENWGFYTLLTQLPKFMKEALHFDLASSGVMSALPYLAMSIFTLISGYLADMCLERKYLTTTQVRKLFNCGAFLAQTVFMLCAGFLLSPVVSSICLTLAVGLGGFAWSGFSINYLDVGPAHASVIMGIGNTFATVPGIISPALTGFLVVDGSPSEWRNVFYIAGGVYLFGSIIYGFFASSELQPWAWESQTLNPSSKKTKGVENQGYVSET